MKKWLKRLVWAAVLLALFCVALLAGHVTLDYRGREALKAAGSRLQELQDHATALPGNRPSVSDRPIEGNAADHYLKILKVLRLDLGAFGSATEAIKDFFNGEELDGPDLELEVASQEALVKTLRSGVASTRCDWELRLRSYRTCGLGGATLAKVGYTYEPWNYGLYDLVPTLAAAGEMERRRGRPSEALQVIVESMGLCIDMARGSESFNARCVPLRLERLNGLLASFSRELNPESAEWERVDAALVRLHHGSEEFLKSWQLDLLLAMHGDVYLPTYPHLVMVDRDEPESSWYWAAVAHKARALGSPHASAAKLYSLSEDLWKTLDSLHVAYDPETLRKAEEAVRASRAQDVYYRGTADSVRDAVVGAFRLEAALRMTRMTWALARHRSRHGAWPKSLDEVVLPPGWEDPFTGKQFDYVGGSRPVLSCAGHASDQTHLPYRPLEWTLPE